MTHFRTFLFIVLSIAAGCMLVSCRAAIGIGHTAAPVVVEKEHHPGPPPHAPAHGYRHKRPDGVQLQYDSSMGVYVVIGHAGLYFSNDRYYRRGDSSWQVSLSIDGGWRAVPERSVPPGLRKPHVAKKGR